MWEEVVKRGGGEVSMIVTVAFSGWGLWGV